MALPRHSTLSASRVQGQPEKGMEVGAVAPTPKQNGKEDIALKFLDQVQRCNYFAGLNSEVAVADRSCFLDSALSQPRLARFLQPTLQGSAAR